MSITDPWEQRERERERWRATSSRSSGAPNVLIPKFSSRILWICSLVALHLIGDIPAISQTLRTISLCIGFVGWMTFLGVFWPSKDRNRTRFLPTIVAVAALIAWVSYRSLGTGFPMQAFGGWLRWMSVGLALVASMFSGGTRSERMMLLVGLGAIAVFVAVVDLSRYGVGNDALRGTTFHASSLSLFGTHEAIGTLLGFLLPVVAAFAVHRGTVGLQKSLAIGASLVIALAWAFARCRAGWLGGIAGCIVVGGLAAIAGRRHGIVDNQPILQRILSSVWLWLITGGGIVLASSGLLNSLTSRAGGALSWWELGSVAARKSLWQTAYQMISEHPILGWGTAGFLTQQGIYSHHGEAPWQVKLTGGTLSNNAHSFPLQFTVDYGAPAFFLFLLMVAWLWGPAVTRSLILHPDTTPMSRAACGLIAAVAVSCLASPAYELTSILVWATVIAGTLLGTSEQDDDRGTAMWATVGMLLMMAVPAFVLYPRIRPTIKSHAFTLTIMNHPKGIGDVAAVKAKSVTDGKSDSSFPGTDFLVPELAVIDSKGRIVRVVKIPDSAVRWTYNRRSNTDADAIIEVTIPDANLKVGEGCELGISGTLRYVDGEQRTAGVAVPVVQTGR